MNRSIFKSLFGTSLVSLNTQSFYIPKNTTYILQTFNNDG